MYCNANVILTCQIKSLLSGTKVTMKQHDERMMRLKHELILNYHYISAVPISCSNTKKKEFGRSGAPEGCPWWVSVLIRTFWC